MSEKPGIWIAGLCGSALANAAIVTVLAFAMRPEPIRQQSAPAGTLDVQAVHLRRDRAIEHRPDPQSATAARPDSAMASAQNIPRSKAFAQAPKPDRVSARSSSGEVLSEVAPAVSLRRPTDIAPTTLIARETRASLLLEHPLPANTLRAGKPLHVEALVADNSAKPALNSANTQPVVLGASPPVSTHLPETMREPKPIMEQATHETHVASVRLDLPDAIRLATKRARPDALRSKMPLPDRATPAGKNALEITAALAFSGDSGGEIDPLSLAAFQSFVRPEDNPAHGKTLRDAVSNLLSHVPCSRLQIEFDPITASVQVKGHIPEDGLRTPVLTALQAQMGADINVSDNMLILPRPQCGALSGIAAIGLPQSTDQNTNPLLIGAGTHVRELAFVRNDRLFFTLTAPDYDAYVYVDFFDAGGNVLHLSPNPQVPLRKIAATSVFQVGAQTSDRDGLQILIGPPYGQEIAVAFAASVPLHDETRPMVEPAAPYLHWLKTRVANARATHPGFKGEWVYFFVRTSER